MGWITKFGTQWGNVPQTAGNVYWVSPTSTYTVEGRSYSASDNNDGLSPERALASIAQAISNATANAGDVIMLLPGAAFTSAATVAINKAGLTFVGCHASGRTSPAMRNLPIALQSANKVQWTSTFAGAGITMTVPDTTFDNIAFIPLTAQTIITCSALVKNTVWSDCAFLLSAAASASTKGVVFTGAGDSIGFVNTHFYNTIGAQGPAFDLTAVTNFHVEKCIFTNTTGTWAIAGQLGAGSNGVFYDCDFVNRGTAITTGIDGTGVAVAAAVYARNCYSTVSPAATNMFKNFTSTDLSNVNCYIATISLGTGGTLITTTT